jgi:hypothetical protein
MHSLRRMYRENRKDACRPPSQLRYDSSTEEVDSRTKEVNSRTGGVDSHTEGVNSRTEGVDSRTEGADSGSVQRESINQQARRGPQREGEQKNYKGLPPPSLEDQFTVGVVRETLHIFISSAFHL